MASIHLVGIRAYLEGLEDQSCSERWSDFVVNNITVPFMADKPQLGLLYDHSSGGAQPDVQAKLLRSLLAGISAEFNVTSSSTQALTLFTVNNFSDSFH